VTKAVELSVIIVSHGHEVMLGACIGSLAPLLVPVKAEIIIVDNLQDGRVAAALAGYQVKLIENRAPQGFAANVNQAARVATGWHLLVLNPDTEGRHGRLADAIAFLDRHPQVGVVGCRLLNPDGSWQQNYRQFPILPVVIARGLGADRWPWQPPFYRRRLMADARFTQPHPVDWVFGAFMLLRRNEFLRLGGMDEGFRLYYEDVDLCYRYGKIGLVTCVYPEIVFLHAHLRTSAKHPFGRTWRWHVASAVRYFRKSGYLFRSEFRTAR
jgi:N-acetylglucosaminyl-diphospho-decaprenol L-rhamnosyltransferase